MCWGGSVAGVMLGLLAAAWSGEAMRIKGQQRRQQHWQSSAELSLHSLVRRCITTCHSLLLPYTCRNTTPGLSEVQSTAQHSTAQHSTAQHSTAQHSTAQHSTAQHSTAQHYTAVLPFFPLGCSSCSIEQLRRIQGLVEVAPWPA